MTKFMDINNWVDYIECRLRLEKKDKEETQEIVEMKGEKKRYGDLLRGIQIWIT